MYISFGLRGGVCLVFGLGGGLLLGWYVCCGEMKGLENGIGGDEVGGILIKVEEIGKWMFSWDGWRRLFVVLIGGVLLWG